MATQLTIVNDVLERLREDTVSTVNESAYSKLIAMFVNMGMEQLRDRWSWSSMIIDDSVSILGDSSTQTYTTGANWESYLLYDLETGLPCAWDVTSGAERQLEQIPYSKFASLNLADSTNVTDAPQQFALSSTPSTGATWDLHIPLPSSVAQTWTLKWYEPQQDLARDGSDDSTVILFPRLPVFHWAVFFALNERGEEMGEPGSIAEQLAMGSTTAAIEYDLQSNLWRQNFAFRNQESLRNSTVGTI